MFGVLGEHGRDTSGTTSPSRAGDVSASGICGNRPIGKRYGFTQDPFWPAAALLSENEVATPSGYPEGGVAKIPSVANGSMLIRRLNVRANWLVPRICPAMSQARCRWRLLPCL